MAAGTAKAAMAPSTRGTTMRIATSVGPGSGAPGMRSEVSIRAQAQAFQHHSSVASSRIARWMKSRTWPRRAANSRNTSWACSLKSSATVPIAVNATEKRASHSTRPSVRNHTQVRSQRGSGVSSLMRDPIRSASRASAAPPPISAS